MSLIRTVICPAAAERGAGGAEGRKGAMPPPLIHTRQREGRREEGRAPEIAAQPTTSIYGVAGSAPARTATVDGQIEATAQSVKMLSRESRRHPRSASLIFPILTSHFSYFQIYTSSHT